MISQDLTKELAIAESAPSARRKAWGLFVGAGVIIYLAIYAYAEYLVYVYGHQSRLFMIATAPQKSYDAVILGASHALPLAFADMNQRLEQASGASVLNLSVEGGGLVPAKFHLDYFLAEHETRHVIYVLDSFVFYARQWNEERVNDPKLLKRAPFDPALLSTLWQYPAAHDLIPGYLSGFYKINNADRFAPDVSDNDGKTFDKVYRANAMIDRQRLAYLFPKEIDQDLVIGYLASFKALAADLKARGIKLTVVRTPLPGRVLQKLSGEAEFNAKIEAILAPLGFALHDFSQVANDDGFFFDTDHLNRAGAVNFIDTHLAELLKPAE